MANGTSPTSAMAGFTPGVQISGYRLEEQIGRGGMAVVFRALDERLNRLVALKILAPVLAEDDAFRQRFIQESRAAAAVDDPNIIPVYEAGEANGALFIATRLVRGGDLRSLVAAAGSAGAGQGGVDPVRRRVGARRGARLRADPPRRQAREHAAGDPAGPARSRLPDRLRGEQGRLAVQRPHRQRAVHRHRRLRGARAGPGPGCRRPDRSVRARLLGLRAAVRPPAVLRPAAAGDDVRAGVGAAAGPEHAAPAAARRRSTRCSPGCWPSRRTIGI